MNELTPKSSLPSLTELQRELIHKNSQKRFADNTEQAYKTALRRFVSAGGSFPTTSLGLRTFIAQLETEGSLRASTIASYVNAVCSQQKSMGFESPRDEQVDNYLSNLKRDGSRPARKGDVFYTDELMLVTATLQQDKSPKGIRDRFLILLMLWTACRTAEIAGLTFKDLRLRDQQLEITLYKQKNDQEGNAYKISIPQLYVGDESETLKQLCLVDAYNAYIKSAFNHGDLIKKVGKDGDIKTEGIKARSIRNIIATILTRMGFDEQRVMDINGHSFRHTLATLASELNFNTFTIQQIGNWKSLQSAKQYTGNQRASAISQIAESLINKTNR